MSRVRTCLKVVGVLICLYFFLASLSFLCDALRLLTWRRVEGFLHLALLSNPIVGLMIGLLATTVVQSSSLTTAIVVSLVSTKTLNLNQATPIIMGANIGTTFTSTLVSLFQVQLDGFQNAITCSLLHDMFNWLTCLFFLIMEGICTPLESLTEKIIFYTCSNETNTTYNNPGLLQTIVKPFKEVFVQLDSDVLLKNHSDIFENTTLLVSDCGSLDDTSTRCFVLQGLQDWQAGLILLVVSLLALFLSLFGLVRGLQSACGDEVESAIDNYNSRDLYCRGLNLNWLMDYLLILLGTVLTFLVQSSSVFTSILIPVAAAGHISPERSYPLTIGANIGTTTTSILASWTTDDGNGNAAYQIALVHLFFNVFGAVFFFIIPCMRWPLKIAKVLGEYFTRFRWLTFLYLVIVYFLFPLFIFALSQVEVYAMYATLGVLICPVLGLVFLHFLQESHNDCLPAFLRNNTVKMTVIKILQSCDRLIKRCGTCGGGGGSRGPDIEMKQRDNHAYQADLADDKSNRSYRDIDFRGFM